MCDFTQTFLGGKASVLLRRQVIVLNPVLFCHVQRRIASHSLAKRGSRAPCSLSLRIAGNTLQYVPKIFE